MEFANHSRDYGEKKSRAAARQRQQQKPVNSKANATEIRASVASGSGWERDTTHHPKAVVVVTVVRIVVVAVGATGVVLVVVPYL